MGWLTKPLLTRWGRGAAAGVAPRPNPDDAASNAAGYIDMYDDMPGAGVPLETALDQPAEVIYVVASCEVEGGYDGLTFVAAGRPGGCGAG